MTLSAQPAHATSCSDSSPNALLGTRISTNRTQTERSGLSRKYPPPPEPHEAERAPQIPLPTTRAGTGHRTRCPRGHPSTRAAGTPSPSNGAAPTPRPEPAVPAPPLAGISAAVPHSGRHPYGVRKRARRLPAAPCRAQSEPRAEAPHGAAKGEMAYRATPHGQRGRAHPAGATPRGRDGQRNAAGWAAGLLAADERRLAPPRSPVRSRPWSTSAERFPALLVSVFFHANAPVVSLISVFI